MGGYKPIKIAAFETGLVKERPEFLLVNDAFTELENAYLWRQTIRKKSGKSLVGRLRRCYTEKTFFLTDASPWSFNLLVEQGYISAATVAGSPPVVITTPYAHNLENGDTIVISEVAGALGGDLNGNEYTVANVSTTTFEITETTANAYTSGGFWFSNDSLTSEPDAQIQCGSFEMTIGGETITDDGAGVLTGNTGSRDITDIDISGSPTLVVTTDTPHGLANGESITISGVNGALGGDLNGNSYTVANVAASTFEITQATANAYTGGGTYTVYTPASGTINYATGAVTLTHDHGTGTATTISYCYYPGLPVMGLRLRELNFVNIEDLVAFDTKYAYELASGAFRELVAGTQWNGSDSDFFWSVNYWVDASQNKLFWVGNGTAPATLDPIRYYNGTAWTDFTPYLDTAGMAGSPILWQAKVFLPFRGRMLMFNTWEGSTTGNAVNYKQRIRWSQIGTPINQAANGSWDSVAVGKGGFLDIPTSQDIIGAGFVRDNLVVFCERSTWVLRYTGRKFQPFEIEKVNTELGAESTFSLINFDTSLVGIGDKRIVSCDSFKCEPIDIKIPDFAIRIKNDNNGPSRVQGIRDIPKRLVYWAYPDSDHNQTSQGTYPAKRLVYNYEEDSWAIFRDSLTCMGTRWLVSDKTWNDFAETTDNWISWEKANFTWQDLQKNQPVIIGGNQQGYVHDLDSQTQNSPSLFITAITADGSTITSITMPNHNLDEFDIIEVSGIPAGTGYATAMNNQVFKVTPTGVDTVTLKYWNATDLEWQPFVTAEETYLGCGQAAVIDNFKITTRKFEHLDEGQKIQVGHIDTLFADTQSGDVTLRVFVDYLDTEPVNDGSDSFFNVTVPTTESSLDLARGTQVLVRSFCPTRGNFVQLSYTYSDEQMATSDALNEVVISAIVIWERMAGRLTI